MLQDQQKATELTKKKHASDEMIAYGERTESTGRSSLATPNQLKLKEKMATKTFAKIHASILKSFPFVDPLFEPMLILSCSRPVPQIVLMSDSFEMISGYTPAEYMTRSIDMLHGKHTSAQDKAEFEQAIASQRPAEIKILHYRKDGSPFWNSFRLLPVYKGRGKVKYFVAIQESFTQIIPANKRPSQWDEIDVAVWLDNNGFSEYSSRFRESSINGQRLLSLEACDLLQFKIAVAQERRHLMSLITQLLMESDVQSLNLSTNESDSSCSMGKTENDSCNKRLALKMHFEGRISIMLVKEDATLIQVSTMLKQTYRAQLELCYVDVEGDIMPITDDETFQHCKELSEGGPLVLELRRVTRQRQHDFNRPFADGIALNAVPTGTMSQSDRMNMMSMTQSVLLHPPSGDSLALITMATEVLTFIYKLERNGLMSPSELRLLKRVAATPTHPAHAPLLVLYNAVGKTDEGAFAKDVMSVVEDRR
eukprot:Colp12_sorted_trinity150504_noHs@12862